MPNLAMRFRTVAAPNTPPPPPPPPLGWDAAVALLAQEPTIEFLGDHTTFAQTGGVVTGWASRFGPANYAQATVANRPAFVAAGADGPNALAYADFDGTKFMQPSWAAYPLSQPFTVVEVRRADDPQLNQYSFGQIDNTTDNDLAVIIGQGLDQLRVGNETLSFAATAGAWSVSLYSWDPVTKIAELRKDGQVATAEVDSYPAQPTTARLLTLAAASPGSVAGRVNGGYALRLVDRRARASAAAFYNDVVGVGLRSLLGLSGNPIGL